MSENEKALATYALLVGIYGEDSLEANTFAVTCATLLSLTIQTEIILIYRMVKLQEDK